MNDLQIEIHKRTMKLLSTVMAQSIIGVQPMPNTGIFNVRFSKSKYKFNRAKWYVAVYNYNYYYEVVEWCAEQFGPHPEQPDAWSRWVHKYEDTIHFRDEKDYAWFVLRWS